MFKPASMSRMNLVLLERDERAVLRHLGRAGAVQLTRTPAEAEIAPPSVQRSGESDRLEQLAARLENFRRALPIPLEAERQTAAEITLDDAEKLLGIADEKITPLLKQREALQRRLAELAAAEMQVSGYCGADLPLDRAEASGFLHFVTGTLPAENLASLKIPADAALLPLSERADRLCVIALTTRRGRAGLDRALQQAGFEPEKLPATTGATADTLHEENLREKKRLADDLSRLDAEILTLSREFAPAWRRIEITLDNERRLRDASRIFFRTKSAVIISGWVASAGTSELEQRLREITGGHCLIDFVTADTGGEEIPVLLQPPSWLRPFAPLVTAYGLPRYQELEPTLFVAASFVLMFGMMFGDVGHGALLALGGLAALSFSRKRKRKVRDAGWLLLTGGISSAVFGLLYGSCFGLPAFKKFALWRDPLEGDPMSLMFIAISAGVAMISLGLILNIINRFRRGDFLGGWLGQFGIAGLVFYWGALMLLAKWPTLQSIHLLLPAAGLFLVLPLIGWLVREPLEFFRNRRAGQPAASDENLFAVITESFVGAFEAMLSYLANTISFVRLAAYAMSHAALLVAAFLMADAVRHLPVAGAGLSLAIIILGNLAAILLEGIIASVQALRLEYYEFFSKFFPGTGRPFQPFCLRTETVADAPH